MNIYKEQTSLTKDRTRKDIVRTFLHLHVITILFIKTNRCQVNKSTRTFTVYIPYIGLLLGGNEEGLTLQLYKFISCTIQIKISSAKKLEIYRRVSALINMQEKTS